MEHVKSSKLVALAQGIKGAVGDSDKGVMRTDIHSLPITEHDTFAGAPFGVP